MSLDLTNPVDFFYASNLKLNDLITLSDTQITFDCETVFDAFLKGDYEGIDGCDDISPFGYCCFSDVDTGERDKDALPSLFKAIGVDSISKLAQKTAFIRPIHEVDYLSYFQNNSNNYVHDIPLIAQEVLLPTNGMLLYWDQAATLLEMYFEISRTECTEQLRRWAKGYRNVHEAESSLTYNPIHKKEDANRILRLLLSKTCHFSRASAINYAQYEYKQMFLKIHSQETFYQWKHWFYEAAAYSGQSDHRSRFYLTI